MLYSYTRMLLMFILNLNWLALEYMMLSTSERACLVETDSMNGRQINLYNFMEVASSMFHSW